MVLPLGSHREGSSNGGRRLTLKQRIAGKASCLGNSLRCQSSPAVFNDLIPTYASGHVIQHVGHQYSSAAKRETTMTNLGIRDHIPAKLSDVFHSL